MNYKWWLLIAVSLFGVGIILGLITLPGVPVFISEGVVSLEQLADLLDTLPLPLVAVFIFLKNVTALLISFVFSPFFCVVPVVVLIVNGWVLSFLAATVVQEESLGFVLAGLLPHGILELPAFIMAEAAALSFGSLVIMAIFVKERRSQLLPGLKRNLRYLMLAFILLVPAAIIETYLTPLLLS